MNYLTGVTNAKLEAEVAAGLELGLLIQPRNHYHARLEAFPRWAADNGAFSKHGFDAEAFVKMLERPELAAARESCLFVVAPDRLEVLADGTVVGDAAGTIEQFPRWAWLIRAHGLPVAFVGQDGVETMLDEIPWELVDVIFLGGSTEWKVGAGAAALAAEAHRRGKPVHMGRVNSRKRCAIADAIGCATVDGTFLAFGPEKNLPRLRGWIDEFGKGEAA